MYANATGRMSSNSETQPQVHPVPVPVPVPGTVPLPNLNNNNSSGMSLHGLLALPSALEQYRRFQHQYAMAAERLGCPPVTVLPVPVAPVLRPEFAPFLYGPNFRPDPRPPVERKPPHRYIGLIAMSILSSPEKKLVVRDICQYILEHYPYFRNRAPDWKNSIRHSLSRNDCFIKAGKSTIHKRSYYWTIHPANMDDFTKGDFRRRNAQEKVRRHMELALNEPKTPPPSSPPSLCHHSGLHHVPVAHLHGQPHPVTMTLSRGNSDVERTGNPAAVSCGRAAADDFPVPTREHHHLLQQNPSLAASLILSLAQYLKPQSNMTQESK